MAESLLKLQARDSKTRNEAGSWNLKRPDSPRRVEPKSLGEDDEIWSAAVDGDEFSSDHSILTKVGKASLDRSLNESKTKKLKKHHKNIPSITDDELIFLTLCVFGSQECKIFYSVQFIVIQYTCQQEQQNQILTI